MQHRELVSFLAKPNGRLIVRNFSVVAVANAINRALKFFYLSHLARVVGAEHFGTISLGYRTAIFFAALADMGLSLQGRVEVARHREQAGEYISSIGLLKVGFSLLACILFAIFGLNIGRTALQREIIILFAPLIVFSEVAFAWPMQGLEQMHHVAVSQVLNGLLGWTLIILLVPGSSGMLWAPIAMGLAGFVSVFYLVVMAWAQPAIAWGWNRAKAVSVLRLALPLGISLLLLRLYNNLDAMLLGIMGKAEDLGLYQAAYMIPQFVWGLCLVLMAAVVPSLTRLVEHSGNKARALIRSVAYTVAGVTLLVSVGGIFLAPQIMKLLYGSDYVNSALAFQLLLIALPLGMARTVLHQAQPVFNRQHCFLLVVVVQLIINFGLNLSLIGPLGYIGPALARIIAEAAGLLVLEILFRWGSPSE
jgi:O-antigen/teichoic acid export membrane protein